MRQVVRVVVRARVEVPVRARRRALVRALVKVLARARVELPVRERAEALGLAWAVLEAALTGN